jgi:hypothetical protein
MHLAKLYSNFDSRCSSYSKRVNYIILNKPHLTLWEFNYFTEVLISDIWQNWSLFCRELVLSSCFGTKARDGSTVPSCVVSKNRQRLLYEASCIAKSSKIKPNGHLNFKRLSEPSWGNIDKLLPIISSLTPNNSNTLLSAFGSFTNVKDIRYVRNACAHKNSETISEISSIPSYHHTKLNYPTDIAWCSNSGGATYAIELWLYEMNLIADLSTSTN